jgi:arsenate reductase (glutaredoxin)
MSTPLIVHGIANCDTVKRARAWLQAHGIDHRFHDFRKAGVPPDRLQAWTGAVGWERLLNRQGTTWRQLDPAAKASVSDAISAADLMSRQPSVIKRPVVDWPDGSTTVGFDEAVWQSRLQSGSGATSKASS